GEIQAWISPPLIFLEVRLTELREMKCIACRGGEPTLTEAQIAELQPQVPDWQVKEVSGEKRLERVFRFKNFARALEFTNKIGAIAEEEDHHPLIITEWGRVTLYYLTAYQNFGNPGYQNVLQ